MNMVRLQILSKRKAMTTKLLESITNMIILIINHKLKKRAKLHTTIMIVAVVYSLQKVKIQILQKTHNILIVE